MICPGTGLDVVETLSPGTQLDLLKSLKPGVSFEGNLTAVGLHPLRATGIQVLQINVGRRCNQTCGHCHVDAGPRRREVMSDEVLEECLAVLDCAGIPTLDVTGGAPEMHPRFREIVSRARALGKRVIHRTNLTVLLLPRYRDLPRFLADRGVELVASLPYYRNRETDAQRGTGVFAKSIEALRRLNALGYGREGSGLRLDLMTNPSGSFLPAGQEAMERDWKRELERRHGVTFDRLLIMVNMPISRFLAHLLRRGQLARYMGRLVSRFNPVAAADVMCRRTLSVGWKGGLYDCDFNQMLGLVVDGRGPRTIFEFQAEKLGRRRVVVGPHCFGCTAGQGSSCGGAIDGS